MYTRKISLSLLLGIAALQPLSANENLSIKRITEFWNDEAFDQAKVQILHFLKEYPESEYRDHLYAMLGDLYLKENAFKEAIAAYEEIAHQDMQNKIEANYLQALFEVEDYRAILKKASKKTSDPKANFLAAESCFRLGKKAETPEVQKTLYIQAAAHYEMLHNTSYAQNALWPLAEIYKALGESSKAARFYLDLSEKHPEEKEHFLFQAAYLQTHFDKKVAVKTFKEIYAIGKTNAKIAVYNVLMLLFELGEYPEFIETYNRVESDLPLDKKDTLRFCCGESFFRVGDLEKAIVLLEQCKGMPALLLLAACAEKTENVQLAEKITKELSLSFPRDPDTAKAHLLCAHLCAAAGDTLRTQDHIKYVLNKFPDYPERERLLFDYALTLYRNTLWEQSREAFESFLNEYKESSLTAEAWRHLLNCALKEGKRELFTSLLGRALNANTFTNDEEKKQRILYVKLLLELGEKQQALSQLSHYLEKYPEVADGHYVAALYHEENPALFTRHAEKALELDPRLPENERLHLQLYNFYVQSNETQDKAADHLYACLNNSIITIKEDNIRWLAGYYFNQKEDSVARARALSLYEKLTANELTPACEKEVLRYAELLEMEGMLEVKKTLLERLTNNQQNQTHLPWKLGRHALFELAKTYQETEEYMKALEAYDLLIRTSTHMPSYFSRAATLESARLKYQLLTADERQETNESMQFILSSLKDLQLRKKLHSEPIHLEAALDYVSVMTALAKEEKKTERALFLLKRVKQDFTERNDMHAKDYQSQRNTLPDQAALLDAYLTFIDMEIYRLEGKYKRAQKLLKKLEKDVHPFLRKRIITSREALYGVR